MTLSFVIGAVSHTENKMQRARFSCCKPKEKKTVQIQKKEIFFILSVIVIIFCTVETAKFHLCWPKGGNSFLRCDKQIYFSLFLDKCTKSPILDFF